MLCCSQYLQINRPYPAAVSVADHSATLSGFIILDVIRFWVLSVGVCQHFRQQTTEKQKVNYNLLKKWDLWKRISFWMDLKKSTKLVKRHNFNSSQNKEKLKFSSCEEKTRVQRKRVKLVTLKIGESWLQWGRDKLISTKQDSARKRKSLVVINGKREIHWKMLSKPWPYLHSQVTSLRNHFFPDPSICELYDFLSQSANVMETWLLSKQLTLFWLLVFSQLSKSQVFGDSPNSMMMPTCTSCCYTELGWLPEN